MTKEEKEKFNENAAKRKRLSRSNQTLEQKEDELTANSIRMRKWRNNQTLQEKEEELKANSIRNSLMSKIPGPCVKLNIQKLRPNLGAEENLRIVAHRNMLLAKYSLTKMPNRVALALEQVNYFKGLLENASIGSHAGHLPDKYFVLVSRKLKRARDKYAIACSVESERESIHELSQDILDLTSIDTSQPQKTAEYFIAKRNMLQAGYDLALFQKTLQKNKNDAEKANAEYERTQKSNQSQLSNFTQGFSNNRQKIVEWKMCLNPHDSLNHISKSEKIYKEQFERMKEECNNRLKRFAQLQQKANARYKESILKMEELQKKHSSATEKCYRKWQECDVFLSLNDDEHELKAKAKMHGVGSSCKKCKMWFYKTRAAVCHEDLCKGDLTIASVLDTAGNALMAETNAEEIYKPMESTKQSLTEEEVANDFINPLTGAYRSLADGVPEHINPINGHYNYGVRKCSKCNEFKLKENFTLEEAEKKADKRVCHCCMGNSG